MSESQQPRYRVAAHVQLYFWIALLASAVVPAMLIDRALVGALGTTNGLLAFAALVAAFQALFWLALRRCSTTELPAWAGLQFITSYMTIGIGSTSLFIAMPTTVIAILGMMGIALLSLLDGSGERAQQRFRSMVVWFSQHRMYQ